MRKVEMNSMTSQEDYTVRTGEQGVLQNDVLVIKGGVWLWNCLSWAQTLSIQQI